MQRILRLVSTCLNTGLIDSFCAVLFRMVFPSTLLEADIYRNNHIVWPPVSISPVHCKAVLILRCKASCLSSLAFGYFCLIPASISSIFFDIVKKPVIDMCPIYRYHQAQAKIASHRRCARSLSGFGIMVSPQNSIRCSVDHLSIRRP